MIIKAVDTKGQAIPQSAEEALKSAITAALKTKNTLETVYWADPNTTEIQKFHTTNTGDKGSWEAWAEGVVAVGKTDTASDRFFVPKSHTFNVHYKLSKNAIGLPDVKVVAFELKPVDNNPRNNIGSFVEDVKQTPLGEIQPQQRTQQKLKR